MTASSLGPAAPDAVVTAATLAAATTDRPRGVMQGPYDVTLAITIAHDVAVALPESLALSLEQAYALVRDVLRLIGAPEALVADEWSLSTFRYYRRRGIIDPPSGTTTHALYGRRHVLQGAAARAEGWLHLITLEDASARWPSLSERALFGKLGQAGARFRRATSAVHIVAAHPTLAAAPSSPAARPVAPTNAAAMTPSQVIALPDGAQIVIPVSHPALRDAVHRAALVAAVAGALEGLSTAGAGTARRVAASAPWP